MAQNPDMDAYFKSTTTIKEEVTKMQDDIDWEDPELGKDPNYMKLKGGETMDLNHPRKYSKRAVNPDMPEEELAKVREAEQDLIKNAPDWPWPEKLNHAQRLGLLCKFDFKLNSCLPVENTYLRLPDEHPNFKSKLTVGLKSLGLSHLQEKIFIDIVGPR